MPGLRFTLDLYIKESAVGTVVAGVRIPTVLANAIPDIRTKVRQLKGYATRINAGLPNEEITVNARYHVCHHEDAGPCDPEVDI
jgi:hypothetical protein